MNLPTLLVILFLPIISNAQTTVFCNARIFTADINHPYAEAIAISGKKIIAVGQTIEVKKIAGAHASCIDLKGGFLMPGLIDSHNHGIMGGKSLTKANIDDRVLTLTELVAYAKTALKNKTGMTGDVLVIYGINIGAWKLLDDISREFNSGEFKTQKLVLRGSDYHTSWCNKAMMAGAGINKVFTDELKPSDKIYFAVDANGEPTGFITESGYRKIESALMVETDFSLAAEKAMVYNNSLGITAWLDPSVASFNHSFTNSIEWYHYLIKKNKLTAHIAATVVADAKADPAIQIDKVKALQKKYNTHNFSIIGFKVFADGVIEYPTQTAALSIPYTGTASKGDLLIEPATFARFATMADKAGLLVHVHAIGDLAVTETLNGFEAARKANHNFSIPHTITHLQIVQPADFTRFAQLNVLTSFQLLWAFGDATTIDIVKPYIDPSLYQWQYPVRSLLQAGAIITGASDWPVSTANPFAAIYRAETRSGPLGVLDSTQCMPRMEMLYAYTINAAKALMAEKTSGSLAVGKFADMILLDRDILTIAPEALNDTNVLWTMFEGKKVFERAGGK